MKNFIKDFLFAYPFNFNGKQPSLLTNRHKTYYTWKYGEEVRIAFEINPKYRNMPIVITVYNTKYEPILILPECYPDLNMNVYLNLDTDISKDIFKEGIYYCEVASSVKIGESVYKTTLIPLNSCILQVTKSTEVN